MASCTAVVGSRLKVAYQYAGKTHEVFPLCSSSDAALVCDVLAVKEALDVGTDLSTLALQGTDPCPGSLDAALLQELSSVTFEEVVAQLQACAEYVEASFRGSQLVHGAAAGGHAAALQLMLAVAPRVASATCRAGTPLHVAATQGHAAAVRLLLAAAPATATAADQFQWLPIAWAASRGHSAALRLLLEAAPATVKAPSNNGQLPVHYAAAGGHCEAVQTLLDAEPDSAAATNGAGQTPLHAAAAAGHVTTVRLLLQAQPGATMAADRFHCLPLHAAAQGGDVTTVQELLRAAPGAATAKASDRRTPLELALRHDQLAAAACLLRSTAVPASHALDAIEKWGSDSQADPLYADFAASRLPLNAAHWQRVPAPCNGIGRALPAALRCSARQASEVMARLPEADKLRLQTFALCLARAQRDCDVALPAHVTQQALALFDS